MKRSFGHADPLQDARRVRTAQSLVTSDPFTSVLGSIIAGAGLIGGGLPTVDVTLNVGAGDGISVGADAVSVDATVARSTWAVNAGNGLTGGGNLAAAGMTLNVGAGNGISVGADAVAVDTNYAFTWLQSHTFNQGASFGGNITLTGDADITLGTEVQLIDHGSHGHIVVNCAVDEQFDIDAGGSIRAQGYFVGKHALQLPGALTICHYDGQPPYNTNFTGDPTGHMGQVATVSGGVIYRPGKFGKAVQIAEATTNLILNPSFEVDTSNWSSGYGAILTRVTTQSYFGSASLQVVWSAGQPYDRFVHSAIVCTALTTYTLSMRIKTINGTATPIALYVNANHSIDHIGTTFYATSTWTRYTYTFTTDSLDSTFTMGVLKVSSSDATTIFVDGVQLEQKNYATPYCDGSLGVGHSWSGTAHASTSSRTAASLTYATQAIPRSGSISMWVNTTALQATNGNYRWIVDGGYTAGIILYVTSTDDLAVWCGGVLRTSYVLTDVNFAPNTWHHIVYTWDEATAATRIYLNGAQVGSTGGYGVPTDDGGGWDVGHQGGAYQWPGWIDDFVLLDRAMSASEVRAVYESNAPVFAETSTWQWRAGNNLAWADSEGLWMLDAAGNAAFGVSGIALKSWGGVTLDAGDILIGRAAASNNNILWDASAGTLSVRNNTTERIGLSAAGVLTVKDSSGNAVFTLDASAGAEFTKPLTIGTSGGIYQGSGTFASPTTGLKIWNDSGVGRIAGYNGGTIQTHFGTDGKLYAGNTLMDASGISIPLTTAYDDSRAVRFMSGSTVAATLYGYVQTSIPNHNLVALVARQISGKVSHVAISADSLAGGAIADVSATYNSVIATLSVQVSGASIPSVQSNSSVFVNESLNSFMTMGMTINQGVSDDEILSLKSSDIAHGMTDYAETDTYGTAKKIIGDSGGLDIAGYTEASVGMALTGYGVTDDTARSTSALGYVVVTARKKSGTGVVAPGADANIIAFRVHAATRAVIDAEGDLHLDATMNQNVWDKYDDVALLETYRAMTAREAFGRWADEHAEVLARTGILTLNPDGHHFVSLKGLHALQIDAIRQLAARVKYLEAKLPGVGNATTGDQHER